MRSPPTRHCASSSPTTWGSIPAPRSGGCTPSSCSRTRPWTGHRRGPRPSSTAPAAVGAAGSDGRAADHPLLGRDAEVDVLERAVHRSAGGHGAVWVVSGEAGIGKTRLAQEVAARARASGTTVAVGQTNETSDSSPYWPWAQVLRNLPGVPGDGPAGVVMGRPTARTSRRRRCTTRWLTSSPTRPRRRGTCWSCWRTCTGRTRRASRSCRRWPDGPTTPRWCCCARTAWRTPSPRARSGRCWPGWPGRPPPSACG